MLHKVFFSSYFVLANHSVAPAEGNNAAELVDDFHGAVDEYLELCGQSGTEPEKAYKGSFNVRISPELHKQAAIAAMSHNMSLNSFVETSIQQALHAGA